MASWLILLPKAEMQDVAHIWQYVHAFQITLKGEFKTLKKKKEGIIFTLNEMFVGLHF